MADFMARGFRRLRALPPCYCAPFRILPDGAFFWRGGKYVPDQSGGIMGNARRLVPADAAKWRDLMAKHPERMRAVVTDAADRDVEDVLTFAALVDLLRDRVALVVTPLYDQRARSMDESARACGAMARAGVTAVSPLPMLWALDIRTVQVPAIAAWCESVIDTCGHVIVPMGPDWDRCAFVQGVADRALRFGRSVYVVPV
ncbi:MAG: hypothetical protein HWE26_13780 [Alteromonadaceae bacterium]|nr:hypothetical protein [Alteromonadaceae bacterium]